MQPADVSPYKGKIALVDLVSGMQVCAEIKASGLLGGDSNDPTVTLVNPIVFQVAVEPQDPQQPPSPMNPVVQKLNAMPYGGPFTRPKDELVIDCAHILTMHEPADGLEKAWMQATSGIEVVGAGAMAGLKGGPAG